MHLNSNQLDKIATVACTAAREAGALIQSYTGGDVTVLHKQGGDSLASQVVTEVDERSQAAILECLKATSEVHDLALLTEELNDDGSRFEKDYFWCIDPLDGTLPFTQGKSGYAVSIALVRCDGQPMIGVVYDPVKDRLYRSVWGQGLIIDGEIWRASEPVPTKTETLRFCMDCTFATDPQREAVEEQMRALAREIGYEKASVEIRGGAVCNACFVLEHAPAVYLKAPKSALGGGCSWDFAATAGIFEEAGAAVTDFFGQPLDLNSSTHTFFNHCGVCYCSDPELAKAVQLAVKSSDFFGSVH